MTARHDRRAVRVRGPGVTAVEPCMRRVSTETEPAEIMLGAALKARRCRRADAFYLDRATALCRRSGSRGCCRGRRVAKRDSIGQPRAGFTGTLKQGVRWGRPGEVLRGLCPGLDLLRTSGRRSNSTPPLSSSRAGLTPGPAHAAIRGGSLVGPDACTARGCRIPSAHHRVSTPFLRRERITS